MEVENHFDYNSSTKSNSILFSSTQKNLSSKKLIAFLLLSIFQLQVIALPSYANNPKKLKLENKSILSTYSEVEELIEESIEDESLIEVTNNPLDELKSLKDSEEQTLAIEDSDGINEHESFVNEPVLSSLPLYSAEELEEMWISHNYIDNNKLHNLLKNYDIQQPTQEFTLNRKFRVASFNIERGYKLDKLKATLRPNPAFDRILEEFPEVGKTESYRQAIKAICKSAKDNNEDCDDWIARFDNLVLDLLDPEISQYTEIFPLKSCSKKYKCNESTGGIFELAKQIHHLSSADVIALQEVDWGMPRTEYVHVVKELAKENGYGYVYATEYIELLDDGTAYSKLEDFDSTSFKGLHGNAILSKWPISNVRILRYGESFTEDPTMAKMKSRRCYDWWHEELPKIGPFEKLAYSVSKVVFKEDPVVPSVRLGSRMALIADIETPEGMVTVASTHLENRGNPKCRRLEMAELVNYLRDVKDQPIVIAGDLNTTNEEARRPYFRHALYWYIRNQFELSTLVANLATRSALFFLDLPVPIPLNITTAVQILNQSREWRNPPGIGTSERLMFNKIIKKFVFDDGTVFDTRGSRDLNFQNSKRLLSNSNQTTPIGYRPTYCFARNYKKIFCMKLDWIFVKGNLSYCGRKKTNFRYANNQWAPTNPRTLFASSLLGCLSNHAAITTDLILPSLAEEMDPRNNVYVVEEN